MLSLVPHNCVIALYGLRQRPIRDSTTAMICSYNRHILKHTTIVLPRMPRCAHATQLGTAPDHLHTHYLSHLWLRERSLHSLVEPSTRGHRGLFRGLGAGSGAPRGWSQRPVQSGSTRAERCSKSTSSILILAHVSAFQPQFSIGTPTPSHASQRPPPTSFFPPFVTAVLCHLS